MAVSQNEQRDDPEHGEQHLFQMRIWSSLTRRGHREKETKNKEDEEINVFTYLVRRNKSLYGECKKKKKNAIYISL